MQGAAGHATAPAATSLVKKDPKQAKEGKKLKRKREPGAGARKTAKKASPFRGVCWHGGANKWVSLISVEGKQRTLGYFRADTDAALAYDQARRLSCCAPPPRPPRSLLPSSSAPRRRPPPLKQPDLNSVIGALVRLSIAWTLMGQRAKRR